MDKEMIWNAYYNHLKNEIREGRIKSDFRLGIVRLSETEAQIVRFDFLPYFPERYIDWQTVEGWLNDLPEIREEDIPEAITSPPADKQ